MRAKVLAWCREERLFAPGDRVVCALSGGADSVALVWCLKSLEEDLQIQVSAAHFNHQLRGAESDRDEAFVREFCRARGIPCQFGRGDVRRYAAETHRSLEDAARALRYDFLLSLPGDKLATAHTADDNAETVLLHLLRGSGLRGLCGIPVKRGKIVRPLLSLTKGELTEALTREGIGWQEDSSNEANDCRRNRLRHEVLPLLRQEEPGLSRKIIVQSALLRQEDEFLDRQARDYLCREGDGFSASRLAQAPAVLRRRALRQMLGEFLPQDLSLAHIQAIEGLLSNPAPSAQTDLPGGWVVRKTYDTLQVEPKASRVFPETPLLLEGTTEIPGLGYHITCKSVKSLEKSVNSPFIFALKYDMIGSSQPILRPRRQGDGIILKNGHGKTLKKLMIDLKIPRYRRDHMPVLVCAGRVLGVLGIGASLDACAAPGEPAWVFEMKEQ